MRKASRGAGPHVQGAADLEALAAAVVRRVLGERPRRLEPLSGGLNNHVFRCEARGRRRVVRLHDDPGRLETYRKEAWAMEQAARAGVPVPEVVALGQEGMQPFMLQNDVPGIPGTHWSDSADVLRQLGALAARLHQVRTRGFGRIIASADPQAPGVVGDGRHCWPRWADYLDHEVRIPERLRMLDRIRALPVPARQALEATLARMRRWHRQPVLQHGDLRLKNTIVSPDDGRVLAVIDWEECLSAPPPH